MKNLAHCLYLSENSIEKALKLTTGQALKDSINFVGHPGIYFLLPAGEEYKRVVSPCARLSQRKMKACRD